MGKSRPNLWRRLGFAIALGALTLAFVAIPTAVVPTPWFTRQVPVRWWEYPVAATTVVLVVVWSLLPRTAPSEDEAGNRSMLSGTGLAMLAVGCPVCNKIVVGALGVSGALGVWAPLQPVLAVVSLTILSVGVGARIYSRRCSSSACRSELVDQKWTSDAS